MFSHKCQEISFEHSLYLVTPAKVESYLKVSSLHTLFYATYGNPKGIPVVVLHGGPGAGCDDSLSSFFDLSRWYVVMFDQRGAIRSRPAMCMEENTPQHSVADMETLRKHLGIEKWMVFGGSWGSTLAILYGEGHPEYCLGFILRGIFLGREEDYLHLLYGMGKVFPEAYEPFAEHIPEEERKDLLSAYYQRIMHPDPEVQPTATQPFTRFDYICSTHMPDLKTVDKIIANQQKMLSITKAFFHYSMHRFFLRLNQILSSMDKIADLPAIIIHGRWDVITLPYMAYLLYKKWKNSVLWMIPEGGHTANEKQIGSALAAATDTFAEKLSNIGGLC